MKKTRIVCILAVLVFLAACNLPNANPTDTPQPPTNTPVSPTQTPMPILPPVIQSVTVTQPADVTLPVQVNVSGEVMDACTTVELSDTQITGQTYQFTLESKRDPELICAQTITPFTWNTTIDPNGLTPGIYTVLVNGSGGTFEVKATPAPNSASISGLVWYDKCHTTGGEGGTPLTPGPNCLQISEYSYTGNGVIDPGETYFQGLHIDLGIGACPSTGYAIAFTDANGQYSFNNLPGGTYCVSLDPLVPENVNILIPGGITFPDPLSGGSGFYNVTLGEGEARTDLNFGWDFQFD